MPGIFDVACELLPALGIIAGLWIIELAPELADLVTWLTRRTH